MASGEKELGVGVVWKLPPAVVPMAGISGMEAREDGSWKGAKDTRADVSSWGVSRSEEGKTNVRSCVRRDAMGSPCIYAQRTGCSCHAPLSSRRDMADSARDIHKRTCMAHRWLGEEAAAGRLPLPASSHVLPLAPGPARKRPMSYINLV